MALIEFKADFKRLVEVLTRIADGIDRAYPVRIKMKPGSIGREALTHISDEKLWERQNLPAETDAELSRQAPSKT